MTRDEYYEIFRDAWGDEAQHNVCIEEMAELTKELCKLKRCGISGYKHEEVEQHIKEEIADVLNCVSQLEIMFGKDEIESIRDEKLKRTLLRLNNR